MSRAPGKRFAEHLGQPVGHLAQERRGGMIVAVPLAIGIGGGQPQVAREVDHRRAREPLAKGGRVARRRPRGAGRGSTHRPRARGPASWGRWPPPVPVLKATSASGWARSRRTTSRPVYPVAPKTPTVFATRLIASEKSQEKTRWGACRQRAFDPFAYDRTRSEPPAGHTGLASRGPRVARRFAASSCLR